MFTYWNELEAAAARNHYPSRRGQIMASLASQDGVYSLDDLRACIPWEWPDYPTRLGRILYSLAYGGPFDLHDLQMELRAATARAGVMG